jgi:hypothetical protein
MELLAIADRTPVIRLMRSRAVNGTFRLAICHTDARNDLRSGALAERLPVHGTKYVSIRRQPAAYPSNASTWDPMLWQLRRSLARSIVKE